MAPRVDDRTASPPRGPGRQTRFAWVIALSWACSPTLALAGMPSPTLTEVGQLRLQSLGFFVATFFVLAKGFQLLWNWLRTDFPGLPTLTFRRAMGVVFVWGMALELVLTMVSGARELLTPGAWEKVGVTYQPRSAAPGTSVSDVTPAAREARLRRLADALKQLPALPRSTRTSGLPDELWVAPTGARYVYLGEIAATTGIIAYEPSGVGDERMTLESDLSIKPVRLDAIEARIRQARADSGPP